MLLPGFVWHSMEQSCIVPMYLFLCVLLASMWCIHTVVGTQLQLLKKSHSILMDTLNFHMINNLSIAVYTFIRHMLTSLSVDELLLLKYMNWSITFRGLPFRVEVAPSLKHKVILCSHGGQFFLLLVPGYAVGIWVGQ